MAKVTLGSRSSKSIKQVAPKAIEPEVVYKERIIEVARETPHPVIEYVEVKVPSEVIIKEVIKEVPRIQELIVIKEIPVEKIVEVIKEVTVLDKELLEAEVRRLEDIIIEDYEHIKKLKEKEETLEARIAQLEKVHLSGHKLVIGTLIIALIAIVMAV